MSNGNYIFFDNMCRYIDKFKKDLCFKALFFAHCCRCDGVAQCPSGENFDGGEEDEGDFCEGSGEGVGSSEGSGGSSEGSEGEMEGEVEEKEVDGEAEEVLEEVVE